MVRLVVSSRQESAIMMSRQGVLKGRETWALVPSERGVMSDPREPCSFSLMVMEP